MALLQALLAFIGRSAGKILNAIFGWAVIALFGRTSSRRQLLLSGVVALAVIWPLLVVGIAFPKAATFFLTFVPLVKSAPSTALRVIWIALALIVPIVVGLVVAAKARLRDEPFVLRLARGFPITLALAAAFLFVFVTVPILRIVSAVRGRSDEHVPLLTEGAEYDEAVRKLERLVSQHGLGAVRAPAPWWAAIPSAILQKVGGRAFHSFTAEDFAYWKGPALEIALYPSDVLIRGEKRKAAWTHGIVAESFAFGPGLQTFDPEAQQIEREIRRIWRVSCENPGAHAGSKLLSSRVADLVRDLGRLEIPYAQWQIVYREIVQLARAIEGEPQLFQSIAQAKEATMRTEFSSCATGMEDGAPERPLESMSVRELVGTFFHQVVELLKKEFELARAEIKGAVKTRIGIGVTFAAGGVTILLALMLLLASAVIGLAHVLPAWAAALVVGVVVLAIGAGLIFAAKAKHVDQPLEKTRRTLKEDVRWTKERLA